MCAMQFSRARRWSSATTLYQGDDANLSSAGRTVIKQFIGGPAIPPDKA